MKVFLKSAAAPAAALIAAIAFGAINTPEAKAGEFCRRDVTGFMTGCGYANMEQCQAASAGVGGDCFRDPFLKDTKNAQSKSNQSSSACAYQPKSSHRHDATKATGAANSAQ